VEPFTFLAAILGALLAVLGARYQFMMGDYEKRLRQVTDFLKDVHVYRYISSDIVVVGPVNAGKTSLVRTMTQFWKAHIGTSPTPFFELHDFVFPKHLVEQGAEEVGGLKLEAWVRAKVQIWDFGGDPRLFEEAIKKIKTIKKCTVLLIIDAEPEARNRCVEYFAANFVTQMSEAICTKSANVDDVFVIFTKIDLLPSSERSLVALQQRYSDCLHRIRTTFGNPSLFAVSGRSGEGIPPLIQKISSIFVDDEGLPLTKAPPRRQAAETAPKERRTGGARP
jgi:GTP-binding protein EngB required for normal cell division